MVGQEKVSLFTATLLNMNVMVGSGILFGPAMMAATAGNASFLGWILVALIFFPIVWSTSQISLLAADNSGFYGYARSSLSHALSFLCSWTYALGYSFAAAVQVFALRNVVLTAFPTNTFASSYHLFGLVVVSGAILVNLGPLQLVGGLQNIITIAKIIPLITLIVLFPFQLNPAFSISSVELSNILTTLPWAIFGFLGFETCCNISGLIKDAEKNAPRAMLLGFFATVFIYTLFHFGVLQVMGVENLIKYGASSFARFIQAPIPHFSSIMDVLISFLAGLTFIGSTLGMIFSNAQLINTLGEKNVLRASTLVSTKNRNGRPWVALLIQGGMTYLFYALVTDPNSIGATSNIGIFCGIILVLISLALLQKRRHMLGAMAITIVGICCSIGLISYSAYAIRSNLIALLPLIIATGCGLFLVKKQGA